MALSHISDIETERLILRAPTSSDVGAWATAIYADSEVMRYMPRASGAPDEMATNLVAWFTELREQRQIGGWLITKKTDGQFMGHCILAYREAFGECELGYALAQAFWGQGYGTESALSTRRM